MEMECGNGYRFDGTNNKVGKQRLGVNVFPPVGDGMRAFSTNTLL